jgi:hypothetical protein
MLAERTRPLLLRRQHLVHPALFRLPKTILLPVVDFLGPSRREEVQRLDNLRVAPLGDAEGVVLVVEVWEGGREEEEGRCRCPSRGRGPRRDDWTFPLELSS